MHVRKNTNNLSISSSAFSAPSSAGSDGLLTPRTPQRISFHQTLLSTPPPSPSLPSLLPRHGKRRTALLSQPRLCRRLLIGLCGFALLVWMGAHSSASSGRSSQPHTLSAQTAGHRYELVGDSSLPDEPCALIVSDKRGKSKWTVWIPPGDSLLQPTQYAEICAQSVEISERLAGKKKGGPGKARQGYYVSAQDPFFVDVKEAEAEGLLPGRSAQGLLEVQVTAKDGEEESGRAPMKTCERSLTYMLDASEAGLAKTLLGLWMSYGLAQKEGRAFFIDDTRWAYGNFSSYFLPPPPASCLPPPPHQILPCPHTSRHLIISAATISHVFGQPPSSELSDPRKTDHRRQRRLFALARAGYEALFRLNPGDACYVDDRTASLFSAAREKGGVGIGLHVRRGDRHPLEYQYARDYLPLDRYLDAAREILASRSKGSFNASLSATLTQQSKASTSSSPPHDHDHDHDPLAALLAQTSSTLVLASDDPDVYAAPELPHGAARAQDRIVLASKSTLQGHHRNGNGNYETDGWEGGFFRDMFFSLGRNRVKWKGPVAYRPPDGSSGAGAGGGDRGKGEADSGPASSAPQKVAGVEEKVPEGVMRLRELVARSYLLDLAVLARADAVVCAVSAAGCRVLAVMMGWERAMSEAGWRNVDAGLGWRGDVS